MCRHGGGGLASLATGCAAAPAAPHRASLAVPAEIPSAWTAREQATGDRQPATGNHRCAWATISRLLDFAVAVVRLTTQLPRVSRRSSSDRHAAESREDFTPKVGVSAKEVRETVYWLEFIQR